MSFLFETIRLGLTNLRLHMLRSILTALGIILGVAAVITMVSIGEGSTAQALAQIERLGARNIIIRSQKPPETITVSSSARAQRGPPPPARYGLTRDDLTVIRENFPDAVTIVPLKEVGSQVLRENRRKTSQAFGTTPDLARVANITMARGRYLNDADMKDDAMVAAIGSEIAKEFFPLEDPVGKTIRIDAKSFMVVGVMAPVGFAGGAGGAQVGRDLNLDVHIPMTTARSVFSDIIVRRSGGNFSFMDVQISELYVEAPSRERVVVDAQRLRRILDVRHPGLLDIGMIVPFELLEQARKAARSGQAVSAAIAAISLLVGGIGIMNIMLATVTERTREIGIRRAIGATRGRIMGQFLVETGVLPTIGGLMGVALGVGLSGLLDTVVPLLPRLPVVGPMFPADASLPPTKITGWSIIVAFLVATATGLVFGIYPARRAANQDPIVALRHD